MKYAVIGTNVPATQLAAAAFVREGIIIGMFAVCVRSTSGIWRSTPVGYGNTSLRDLRHPTKRRLYAVG